MPHQVHAEYSSVNNRFGIGTMHSPFQFTNESRRMVLVVFCPIWNMKAPLYWQHELWCLWGHLNTIRFTKRPKYSNKQYWIELFLLPKGVSMLLAEISSCMSSCICMVAIFCVVNTISIYIYMQEKKMRHYVPLTSCLLPSLRKMFLSNLIFFLFYLLFADRLSF